MPSGFELVHANQCATRAMKLNTGAASRLRTLHEGRKAHLLKLNIPMPCPPRGTVPVNARAWFRECVSPQHARFAFGQGCDRASYVDASLTHPNPAGKRRIKVSGRMIR